MSGAWSHHETRPDTAREAVTWLNEHGDALFRYALARVRDRHVAEDLVQEALLGAIAARAQFRGECSTRTWLLSILRRRVVDHFRQKERNGELNTSFELSEAVFKEVFNDHGLWRIGPKPWRADFDGVADKAEFWAAFARCLAKLPAPTAEAFLLREREDLSAEEIGNVLGKAATNVWVMLHRARTALRECLERTWFTPSGE